MRSYTIRVFKSTGKFSAKVCYADGLVLEFESRKEWNKYISQVGGEI